MKDFLSKDNGKTLEQHFIDGITVFDKIVKELSIDIKKNEKIINLCKYVILLHDIGKTCDIYQKRYKGENIDDITRHNVIGYYLLKNIIDWNKITYGKDILLYSILFHHKSWNVNNNDTLDRYYNLNDIYNIIVYYNNIIEKYKDYLGCESIFKDNLENLNLEDCVLYDIKVFKFLNLSNTETPNLISQISNFSDFELVFTITRYVDWLISGSNSVNNKRHSNIFINDLICPDNFDKKRWYEQLESSAKCFNKPLTILNATMGYGKTLVGLMYCLRSENRLYWVCPDNELSISTFFNIKDLIKICGINLKTSLLLSNQWIDSPDEYNVDIVVTNIDNYVNGIFRNGKTLINFDMLSSNCIFDEYHEYAYQKNALLPLFISMIKVRKQINNIKTLCLSGTPIIDKKYIDINDDDIIKIEGIECIKKVNLKFINEEDLINELQFNNDYFVITSSINHSQELYKTIKEEKDNIYCFHSLFDNNDTKNKIDNIIKCNGKNKSKKSCTLITTSIFSRGFDVSFKKCYLINPTPYMIEQATGRIERWNTNNIGEVIIVISNKSQLTSIYKNGDFYIKNKYNIWNEHYKPYLEQLKEFYNNKEITIKELKSFRESFFNEKYSKNKDSKSNITRFQNIITNNIKEGIEILQNIEYTDGIKPNITKSDNCSYTSDKTSVRGNNLNRFFIVTTDKYLNGNFQTSDIINIPEYFFGEDGFYNLNNDNIIQNIRKYFELNKDKQSLYGIKNIKKWKTNYNLFKHLLNKAKCSNTPFPLLCNYTYSQEIGIMKK